jgi:cytochrome b561
MTQHTIRRYDGITLFIHWATALLVIITFSLGPEHFGRLMEQGVDPATHWDIVWHESLGISILLLTSARFVWMAMRPAVPQFEMVKWMDLAAKLMHLALLLLLVIIPVTALLTLGSEGYPLTLLGGIRVDQLSVVQNSGLSKLADWGEVHKFLGDTLIALAGLHAAAGIFHHVVLKDDVLLAMRPR